MGKEIPRGRFPVERRGFIPLSPRESFLLPLEESGWDLPLLCPRGGRFKQAVCESLFLAGRVFFCWSSLADVVPTLRTFFIFPEYSPVSDRLRSTRYGSCFMQLALLRTVVPLGFLLSYTESAILLAQDLRLFLRKFTQSTSLGRQPDNGASWRKLER